MRYIDVHAHVFPDVLAPKVIYALENYYILHCHGDGTVNGLIQNMEQASISKCVIFSTATAPEQVAGINNFIAGIVKKYPDRFIGFGTMHPAHKDCRGELKRIKELGLRGIKFHPDFQHLAIDCPEMMKLYDIIGPQFPITMHLGDTKSVLSSPIRLAKVLKDIPDLLVIAAHFGGHCRWQEAEDNLAGKNIYFDTSSSLPWLTAQKAKHLISVFGVDKILFASDFPADSPQRAIQEILSIGLTEQENELIFYKNAERLFNISAE